MDELKKLLENAGMQRHGVVGDDQPTPNDDDLSWGDELIEDLKLLLSETENLYPEIGFDELKMGLVDLISQYDSSYDEDPIGLGDKK